MTIDDMRERLRMLLASARQHENATEALARRINRCLMLFDDCLYDLASGDHVLLARASNNNDTNNRAATNLSDASVIAEAASRLLSGAQADTECIMLLLPPAQFLASAVTMPGLTIEAMRAALQLQSITQLPEYDRPLKLALTAHNSTVHNNTGRALVWWISGSYTNELFNAFAARSLFLAALLPRPALLITGLSRTSPSREQAQRNEPQQGIVLQDSDKQTLSVLARMPVSTGDNRQMVFTCRQTAAQDLQDPALYAEWQQELARSHSEHINYHVANGEDYLRLLRQHNLPAVDHDVAATAAFPDPALAARHQLDRGRRRGLILKSLAAVLALVTLPFIYQSWQLRHLDNKLAQIRVLSADAHQYQASVREFETRWGVMTEFPDQDVGTTMLGLQQVINPGVLTMFEIEEGFISIEGESPDPQNILEQLEKNPLFTEVDFARATNNNRYFIDLRLSTVDFPAYQQWYFPEPR